MLSNQETALLEQLLELPFDARQEIAARMAESLQDAADFQLSPAWRAELERRIAEIRNGTAELITVEEAMARIHEKLRGMRSIPKADAGEVKTC